MLSVETAESIWVSVAERLKARFRQDTYNLWLKPIRPVKWEDRVLTLEVPNTFFLEWVKKNGLKEIEEDLKGFLGSEAAVVFEPAAELSFESLGEPPASDPAPAPPSPARPAESPFNARYTFESFVVGPSNRFAQAAALAVAQNPGRTYNPLFLYGGVGLGKTHILHAIGNAVRAARPGATVFYVTSEQFINEFIDGLRFDRMKNFRAKYRSADCLLIDDIQSLTGKDNSQEEFFYTFNSLHDTRKQIVISSDRPPAETKVSARLISRFGWGVVADIRPPDLETRIAILRKKAAAENLFVPDDVILYIAGQIRTNIRELEGSLVRTAAFSALTGAPLTIDSARETLKDIVSIHEESRPVRIEHIQEVVADHFNLELRDMKSKRRTDAIAFPRQIAMYLARTLTECSTVEIGRDFGGKDHTTVMHACSKIRSKLTADPYFTALINKITQQVRHHASAADLAAASPR